MTLDGVAPLIADPPPVNSINMQRRLVWQEIFLCIAGTVYLTGPAKPPLLLNQWSNFKILLDLEYPKAVQHKNFSFTPYSTVISCHLGLAAP